MNETTTTEPCTCADVGLCDIDPRHARNLLARAFEGAIRLRDGEELDTWSIEFGMSDSEVLEWLQMALTGYELRSYAVHHDDGTATHYPCLMR